MPNVSLTNGEQYTFGKIAGTAVILDGTDNAQAAFKLKNRIEIDANDQGTTTGFVLDQTIANNTTPMIKLHNNSTAAAGDAAIEFETEYNGGQHWRIGVDANTKDFKFMDTAAFTDSNYVFKLDTDGNAYVENDLTVNDELDVDLKLNLLTNNANSAQGAATANQNIIHIEMSDDQSSGYSDASNGQNAGWIKWNANANEHTLLGWDIQQKKFRHLNYDGTDWQGFNVDQSGNMNIAGTYSSSDIRLKKNVNTITGSLDLITQMRGVTFDWKKQANSALSSSAGLIAQEVESIPGIPAGLIDTDSAIRTYDNDGNLEEGSPIIDNKKSINYAALSGYYIEAIKEQQIMIENLKARIEALENA